MAKNTSFLKYIVLIVIIAFAVFLFYDANYGDNIIGITLGKTQTEDKADKEDKTEDTPEKIEDTSIPAGSIRLEEDGKSTFVPYGKGFMHITRDGVKFYEGIGRLAWSDVFSITSPSVVTGGEYSAVCDLLGRTAKVYNTSGLKYTVNTDENIHFAAINEKGNLAVILKGKNNYKVQVYSSSGELKFQRFDEDDGVFPICADISDDGSVLAISYTDTSDIEMLSKVLFFYTNKNDSKEAQTTEMFAACEINDEIIAAINYSTGDEFICVSDKAVFAINTSGETVWRKESGNAVERVAFCEDGYIAVGYGEELISSADVVEKGTVLIINFGGKETGKASVGDNITSLYAGEYVVAAADGKFYGIKSNGNVLWEHNPTQDVNAILPLDGNNVLYQTASYADVTIMTR